MKDHFCEQEAAVIRAARSNEWAPSLRAHMDSCAVCRETGTLASAMSLLVLAESSLTPPTPDPHLLWLKASFAEGQKRSTLISRIAGIAYAVLAAALGIGVYSQVGSGFNSALNVMAAGNWSISSAAPFLVVLVAILIVVLLSAPGKLYQKKTI